MSKLYYYANSPFPDVKYTNFILPPPEDRADQLSYQTVAQSVENFIASGRAISSLRKATATLDEKQASDVNTALQTELNAFDAHPYGIDLAEASMEIKRLNAKAEQLERENEAVKERAESLRHILESHDKSVADKTTSTDR